jgi:hypothetical protein
MHVAALVCSFTLHQTIGKIAKPMMQILGKLPAQNLQPIKCDLAFEKQ